MPSARGNRAATMPARPPRAFMTHLARSRAWAVAREDLSLRGGLRQLGKLIVADFGLGHQDTAAKMLDQIAADRAEPPSRQRPGGTMPHDDEVGSDLFGDPRELPSGSAPAQPPSRPAPSAKSRWPGAASRLPQGLPYKLRSARRSGS